LKLFDLLIKKHKYTPQENIETPAIKSNITGTGRIYNTIDTYDTALKFWLPEVMKTALIEMCRYANTSSSDIIRQTLFTYLYGRYDLFGLIERGHKEFALSSSVLFSKSGKSENKTPELGKNTEDVKVWIAKKMKDDLQLLADKANLRLSHFVREILISNLFGHTYLPERKEIALFEMTSEDK